jgi:Na+/H+-dicarboxylate symporter
MKLWTKILIGLFAGALFGLWLPSLAPYTKPIGDGFIQLINMLIVPLIFSSLLVGVTSIDDTKKMGRIGLKTLLLYLGSTAFAITIGLLVSASLQPGVGVDLGTASTGLNSPAQSWADTLVSLIPRNPVAAMANGHILQIIIFAILLGIALNLTGSKAKPVIAFFDGLAEGMYKLTGMVMALAPYGVFCLIGYVASQYGLAVLLPLGKVVLGVYLGCVIHAVVILGGALFVFGRFNPIRFFKGIVDAIAVAYSTASSSGTLPVSIRCVRKNLGVSDSISSFVLPMGATINMDGTAIYQGVCAIFIAQAYGIELTLGHYATLVLTSTFASIGSAGVPGAGLIMLTLVLNSVGLPLEGIAIIAGIDRILDMARTTVNVVGDCAVTVLVAQGENELN